MVIAIFLNKKNSALVMIVLKNIMKIKRFRKIMIIIQIFKIKKKINRKLMIWIFKQIKKPKLLMIKIMTKSNKKAHKTFFEGWYINEKFIKIGKFEQFSLLEIYWKHIIYYIWICIIDRIKSNQIFKMII